MNIKLIHKLSNHKLSFLVINLSLFFLFFYVNSQIPFFEDDFGFRFNKDNGELITNLQSSIQSANIIYMSKFGRYFASVVNPLVQLYDKLPFNIINSLILLVVINQIRKLVCIPKTQTYQLLILSIMIIISIPNFIGTVLWLSASVEYFWAVPFFLLLVKLRKDSDNYFFITLLSFFVASYNEIFAIAVISFNAFYLLDDIEFNLKKVMNLKQYSLVNIFIVITSIVAGSLTIFAPGNFVRLNNLATNDLEVSNFIFSSARLLYYILLELWLHLIILVSLLLIKNRFVLRVNSSSHMIFVVLIILFGLTLAGGFSLRTLLLPSILIIYIIVQLISETKIYSIIKVDHLAILSLIMILAVGSIVLNQVHMIADVNSRNYELDVYEMLD